MHAAQKELMVRYFANLKYRVAITSDMWTAGHQKKGYMVTTNLFLQFYSLVSIFLFPICACFYIILALFFSYDYVLVIVRMKMCPS
jgi:hypothetical protein